MEFPYDQLVVPRHHHSYTEIEYSGRLAVSKSKALNVLFHSKIPFGITFAITHIMNLTWWDDTEFVMEDMIPQV